MAYKLFKEKWSPSSTANLEGVGYQSLTINQSHGMQS